MRRPSPEQLLFALNLPAVSEPPTLSSAKELGAYYTNAQIADFLAWWAIRSSSDTVLDPCFGGGVFIRSAAKRLRNLEGGPEGQVFGVEMDAEVYNRIATQLSDEFSIPRTHLHHADFFSILGGNSRLVDSVIGNPPFIRYQRFCGISRERALHRAREYGVYFSELCSSWAPFLVHCTRLLKPSGRLAMVVPMEIGHAKYALPLFDHLHRTFSAVTFLTFRKKLFPDLSQDTLLLLAEGKSSGPAQFSIRDFAHLGMLSRIRESGAPRIARTRAIQATSVVQGQSRLIDHLIPAKALKLYRELAATSVVQPIGNVADIGIGYVTGANHFFHIQPKTAREFRIPDEFLKPVVRRGRALAGLSFTHEDWQHALQNREAALLLHIPKDAQLPDGVVRYLKSGERQGVHDAYKCRTRAPWYSVPHVHRPDSFLTYMSGETPRLVTNDAGAYTSNSLHVLRLRSPGSIDARALSTLWQTSLTRLSVELEGHALGGGMLKLEPSEAQRVLVPVPRHLAATELVRFANELDKLVRSNKPKLVQESADAFILKGLLGLSPAECHILRSAAMTLQARRGYKGT